MLVDAYLSFGVLPRLAEHVNREDFNEPSEQGLYEDAQAMLVLDDKLRLVQLQDHFAPG